MNYFEKNEYVAYRDASKMAHGNERKVRVTERSQPGSTPIGNSPTYRSEKRSLLCISGQNCRGNACKENTKSLMHAFSSVRAISALCARDRIGFSMLYQIAPFCRSNPIHRMPSLLRSSRSCSSSNASSIISLSASSCVDAIPDLRY